MSPPEHERKLAEELRLRPERPTVTRLSRKVLITLAGASSSLVLGLTLWALHERSGAKAPPELYNTDAKTTADGLATLPRDYTGLPKNVPKLGPPLPGDLGRPILAAQGQLPQSTIDPEEQRVGQEREAARTANSSHQPMHMSASARRRKRLSHRMASLHLRAPRCPRKLRPSILARSKTCRNASSRSSMRRPIVEPSAPTGSQIRPRVTSCKPARSFQPR